MEQYKIKVLVVDDEKEVRQVLVNRLSESGYWDIVGQTDNVSDTINFIRYQNLDAVFLDIKIRQGSAFDVLDFFCKNNIALPSIIINTGFNEFQLAQNIFNNYKKEVITILQKPFWENWVIKEIEIVQLIKDQLNNDSISLIDNILQIRIDALTHFINVDEIVFIEIEEKQSSRCKIALRDKTLVVNKSLAKLLEMLPSHFVLISRQTIINKSHRKSFNHETHELEMRYVDYRTFYVSKSMRKGL